ncbi:lantibiotic dehydratase [Chryseobacterium sp. RP-3-3]|uniref:Lantibiotic dehydratase n=1 Tax=Chryseobacterium antibioticum TaxID=2728847 RepID=A0A7Y0AJ64_9FLAO|nr:thiopeptide-type bacteriocin biosynthesis protein [Chryseobacterium antibioticum]NML68329.1 lantibiotic dehydratase [Chryseobacterium antibioticum]
MVKRKFSPGTEWLYLKIYTGIKTADGILEEAIQSLVEDFQKNNYISQWFFLRYTDPKPHIRIRFRLNIIEYYGTVLDRINQALLEYLNSGEISNILIDTYSREIERYGENTIEDAEQLFCKNSEFTLLCLDYDDEEKIIISLFYIDEILKQLKITVHEKLDWIKNFNHAFKTEFKADKKLNSQLDKKYREFKPKFTEFVRSEEFSEERNAVISNIEESSAVFQNILIHNKNGSLGIPLQHFFQSIFHMNINRLFVSNQRLFEMVIYDYLLRHYKTSVYQNNQ